MWEGLNRCSSPWACCMKEGFGQAGSTTKPSLTNPEHEPADLNGCKKTQPGWADTDSLILDKCAHTPSVNRSRYWAQIHRFTMATRAAYLSPSEVEILMQAWRSKWKRKATLPETYDKEIKCCKVFQTAWMREKLQLYLHYESVEIVGETICRCEWNCVPVPLSDCQISLTLFNFHLGLIKFLLSYVCLCLKWMITNV